MSDSEELEDAEIDSGLDDGSGSEGEGGGGGDTDEDADSLVLEGAVADLGLPHEHPAPAAAAGGCRPAAAAPVHDASNASENFDEAEGGAGRDGEGGDSEGGDYEGGDSEGGDEEGGEGEEGDAERMTSDLNGRRRQHAVGVGDEMEVDVVGGVPLVQAVPVGGVPLVQAMPVAGVPLVHGMPVAGAQKSAKKGRRGKDSDDEDGDTHMKEDDPMPEYDIKGADNEYPHLPPEHQPFYPARAGEEAHECYWGGARYTKGSAEWERLTIPACERKWKCSMSANFRVVKNSAPNVTRHLHHSGPHMSMVSTRHFEPL
jgi:hypothetical protein